MLGRDTEGRAAVAGSLRAAGARSGQPRSRGYRWEQFNHRGHREHRETRKAES